jgi:hypothetical protein
MWFVDLLTPFPLPAREGPGEGSIEPVAPAKLRPSRARRSLPRSSASASKPHACASPYLKHASKRRGNQVQRRLPAVTNTRSRPSGARVFGARAPRLQASTPSVSVAQEPDGGRRLRRRFRVPSQGVARGQSLIAVRDRSHTVGAVSAPRTPRRGSPTFLYYLSTRPEIITLAQPRRGRRARYFEIAARELVATGYY